MLLATLVIVVGILWSVGGVLMVLSFHEDGTLPNKNPLKHAVAIIACGPVVWIGMIGIAIYKRLRTWLRKE